MDTGALPSRDAGEGFPCSSICRRFRTKIKEAAAPTALTGAGIVVKGQQIVLPPLAAGHGAENSHQPGPVVDVPQELGGRQIRSQQPQAVQLLQKGRARPVPLLRPRHRQV